MTGSGDDGQARIVVGIDGSECSKDALRWAARQAGFTGAALDAVIGWQYPVFYGWAPGPQDFDFGAAAGQALTGALDEVLGAARPAGLRARVVDGRAAQVLVDASAGADLLVVGSRGHGGLADARLGQHILCPARPMPRYRYPPGRPYRVVRRAARRSG